MTSFIQRCDVPWAGTSAAWQKAAGGQWEQSASQLKIFDPFYSGRAATATMLLPTKPQPLLEMRMHMHLYISIAELYFITKGKPLNGGHFGCCTDL